MGIGFVLFLYIVVSMVLATVCGKILFSVTQRYLKHAPARRTKMAKLARNFPFKCVLFAGCGLSDTPP